MSEWWQVEATVVVEAAPGRCQVACRQPKAGRHSAVGDGDDDGAAGGGAPGPAAAYRGESCASSTGIRGKEKKE